MIDNVSCFGLEFNPFLKNSREIIVETEEFKEAQLRLDYLTSTKGFGLLTGPAGMGKTTIVRHWASRLNPSLYKVVYSSLSTLTVQEFYRHLAEGLGSSPAYRKVENFRIIQDEITRLCMEKKKTPVIIIDEANYINSAILNDLKILFNFEMDSRDRAVILLSGLPQLNLTLRHTVHEPFRQRIIMNYSLDGMTKEEARSYILEKLSGAGCHQEVFEDAALTNHLQKATVGVLVLGICTHVVGEDVDTLGEDSDLNLGRTGIGLMGTVCINDCSFLVFTKHSKNPPFKNILHKAAPRKGVPQTKLWETCGLHARKYYHTNMEL